MAAPDVIVRTSADQARWALPGWVPALGSVVHFRDDGSWWHAESLAVDVPTVGDAARRRSQYPPGFTPAPGATVLRRGAPITAIDGHAVT